MNSANQDRLGGRKNSMTILWAARIFQNTADVEELKSVIFLVKEFTQFSIQN